MDTSADIYLFSIFVKDRVTGKGEVMSELERLECLRVLHQGSFVEFADRGCFLLLVIALHCVFIDKFDKVFFGVVLCVEGVDGVHEVGDS